MFRNRLAYGVAAAFNAGARSVTPRALSALGWLWLLLGVTSTCLASDPEEAEEDKRNVAGIMDNSFLVEEAYNQEKNVVQHIFTALYGLNRQPETDDQYWSLAFTQEWPVFSQAHQFSYTLPYAINRIGGQTDNGLGDVLLNYRFQAYLDETSLTAFAPRASAILPTGDEASSLGEDTYGAQFNLPFSTTFGDRWFVHANAGLTWLPRAASAQRRDLIHYNLGASAIYAHTRDLHFLVEWVGFWTESAPEGSSRHYDFASLVSPGLRKAFNFANGSQLVAGIAAPIGVTRAAPDFGVFLYLSFEHFLTRQRH